MCHNFKYAIKDITTLWLLTKSNEQKIIILFVSVYYYSL